MIRRLITAWDNIERNLAMVTLAIAFILSFVEVIARMAFNTSFYWAKEYIIFCTIWSTFLGASQVIKKSQHIRLSVVIDLLPPKIQNYFNIFNISLGIGFGILLFVSGFNLTAHALSIGVTSTSLAKTPMWIPYSIMPLTGLLFTVRFVELLIATMDKIKNGGVSG